MSQCRCAEVAGRKQIVTVFQIPHVQWSCRLRRVFPLVPRHVHTVILKSSFPILEASFCFVHHQLIFSSEKAEWSWMRVQRKFCNALAKGNPSTRLRAMSHSFAFQQRFQQHFDRSCASCYGCLFILGSTAAL